MIIIGVFWIIGIFIIGSINNYDKWYKWIFPLFINLVISFVLGMFIGLGISYFYEKDIEYDINNPIYLQAISTGNEISASMFIGSGMINEKSYYYYYKIIDDGDYIQDKIPTTDVRIHEEENCNKPRILIGHTVFKNGFSYLVFCPKERRYKIIVPKNSVNKKIDFSLNK